jgi:hypothetical protein
MSRRGMMTGSDTAMAGVIRGLLALVAITCGGAVGAGRSHAADAPPVVKRFFPAGGAAGSTVVVKAEGTFPRWPVQVWTDRPGTTWKPLEEKGAFEVAIAPEDSLGMHRVRLFDAAGATGVRRFVVGGEAEMVEAEPNDRPAEAQRISSFPVTVNGVLEKAGDVDGFSIALEAGETLVAAVDAHGTLGSPVDAVLELTTDRGGYLARNLDARGLDPRIVFTAPRAGDVTVRIYGFPAAPNQTIGLAGASDYVYRLTLSTGPVVAAAVPAAVAAGATTSVTALGWNLPADPPVVVVRPEAAATGITVGFAGMAGAVELPVVAATIVTAGAGGAEPAAAVAPPTVVAGWFDAPGREAAARIIAKKDQTLLFTIEARAHGSEAEALLEIRDATGAVVHAKTDRDPPFSWKPPADGDYTLAVRDRRGAAGPGHFFRIAVEPEAPELRVTTAVDAAVGTIGGTADVAIAVERLRGWKQPVEFVLVNPPAGISATPVTSAVDGDTAKKVTLAIGATQPYAGPVTIAARTPAPERAKAETVAIVVSGTERVPTLWLTVPPAPAEEPKKP